MTRDMKRTQSNQSARAVPRDPGLHPTDHTAPEGTCSRLAPIHFRITQLQTPSSVLHDWMYPHQLSHASSEDGRGRHQAPRPLELNALNVFVERRRIFHS